MYRTLSPAGRNLAELLCAVFLLGLVPLFAKLIPLDAVSIILYRCAFGGLGLLAFVLWRRGALRFAAPRDYLHTLVVGVLFAAHLASYFHAIQLTTVAVAIAASRLAYEPGWSAPKFLEHLQQERRRLDILSYDDQSVRLSAHVSYDMLQPEEQAVFAALGAFSPENVNVEALAAVTERQPEATEATLRQLYGLSLVQVGQGERYRLHPLLHDFAREQLRLEGDGGAVFGRMVDFYTDYVDGYRHNYDALERELDNLLIAVDVARDEEMHVEMIEIVTGLQAFLETRTK
jgi:hypothetical protein